MPRSHEARKCPSKAHLVFFWSVKSHLGLELQPQELSAPEGNLSVSGELIFSFLPRHLPPATLQCHMACGGAFPGRLCREPWELQLVGAGRGRAHAQEYTRACLLTLLFFILPLSLSPFFPSSLSPSLSFSVAPPEACQPAGSTAPRLGACTEKPSLSQMAGNLGDQPSQPPSFVNKI